MLTSDAPRRRIVGQIAHGASRVEVRSEYPDLEPEQMAECEVVATLGETVSVYSPDARSRASDWRRALQRGMTQGLLFPELRIYNSR